MILRYTRVCFVATYVCFICLKVMESCTTSFIKCEDVCKWNIFLCVCAHAMTQYTVRHCHNIPVVLAHPPFWPQVMPFQQELRRVRNPCKWSMRHHVVFWAMYSGKLWRRIVVKRQSDGARCEGRHMDGRNVGRLFTCRIFINKLRPALSSYLKIDQSWKLFHRSLRVS